MKDLIIVICYTIIGCIIGSLFLYLFACDLLGIDPKEKVKRWYKIVCKDKKGGDSGEKKG